MHIVAMLPFVLVAAGIAMLVLRGDATRRRHASVRPPDLEPPSLPGRSPAPRPVRTLAFDTDATPRLTSARASWARASATARPRIAQLETHARAHPTAALAVVGGVAFVVMLLAILAQPRNSTPRAEAQPSHRGAAPGTTAKPTGAASTAPAAAATTPPTPPAGDTGAPLSGDRLISAWTAAGLKVEAADQIAACGATKPRAYRANGSQVAMVFVYASPPALSADWAVERGAPLAFRTGGCLPTGAVTYWNQNIVLSFPQLTDAGVKQQMSDALLRMVVAP